MIRYLLFHSPVDQSSSLQLQVSLQFLYVNWNYIPCVYYNPCPVEFQITREVEVSSGIVLDTVLGNSSRLGFVIHECFGKRRSLGSIPSPNLLPSLRRLDRLYGAQAIETGGPRPLGLRRVMSTMNWILLYMNSAFKNYAQPGPPTVRISSNA